jgi:hypothetical protein
MYTITLSLYCHYIVLGHIVWCSLSLSVCVCVCVCVWRCVRTIAMDGKVLPSARQQRELWDHFLRELVWAIHVVPPSGDHRQLVRRQVSTRHHLGTCLGRRVWICRLQGTALRQAWPRTICLRDCPHNKVQRDCPYNKVQSQV